MDSLALFGRPHVPNHHGVSINILICNNIQSVIPTIASRCQKLHFQKLKESTMIELADNIFESQGIELI